MLINFWFWNLGGPKVYVLKSEGAVAPPGPPGSSAYGTTTHNSNFNLQPYSQPNSIANNVSYIYTLDQNSRHAALVQKFYVNSFKTQFKPACSHLAFSLACLLKYAALILTA